MSIHDELIIELEKQDVDIVRFVDISRLSEKQNKGYTSAILIGITLSPEFLQNITNTPNYLKEMVCNNPNYEHEFHIKELETDKIANAIAGYLISKGYSAYSQSEDSIYTSGCFDVEKKETPLPHKTIASLAGLGWIGKHNLLVTKNYGSAISMCTILTDAPLKTVLNQPTISQCGDCNICVDICPVNAIKGKHWDVDVARNERIDVHKCTPCLKCLVHCPWTQKYMSKNLLKNKPSIQ